MPNMLRRHALSSARVPVSVRTSDSPDEAGQFIGHRRGGLVVAASSAAMHRLGL